MDRVSFSPVNLMPTVSVGEGHSSQKGLRRALGPPFELPPHPGVQRTEEGVDRLRVVREVDPHETRTALT